MSDRAGQGRRALDEALRLLDVLQAAPPQGPDPAAPGAHAGGECAICPVCRGIAYLRRADPDAVDRITGAVADLGAALRDLLGAAPAGAAGAPDDSAQGEAADGPGADGPGADGPGADGPGVDGPGVDGQRVQVQHVDVQRIDVAEA